MNAKTARFHLSFDAVHFAEALSTINMKKGLV